MRCTTRQRWYGDVLVTLLQCEDQFALEVKIFGPRAQRTIVLCSNRSAFDR